VIRRALAPDAALRYQTAAELSADLQSVADDLPLCHAREPWSSRATGWFRRKRRRLATALAILLAATLGLAVAIGFLLDKSKEYDQLKQEYDRGLHASKDGDYSAAKLHFDATVDRADRLQLSLRGYLTKLRNFRHLGSQLTDKVRDLPSEHDLEELKALANAKSNLAERIGRVRGYADALDQAADGLRFRLLLGEGSELTRASLKLQELLAPFFVFENPDWTTLDHTLNLLDSARRDRLLVEVNELLFLWMAAVDESLAVNRDVAENPRVPVDQPGIGRALMICERSIVWVEPKAPWLALEARLQARQSGSASGPATPGGRPGLLPLPGEPRAVTDETSALACFQWGLLCYRDGRHANAIDWLQRAVRL
jgi:eukaryotic-like serine/threonine-protein kinase